MFLSLLITLCAVAAVLAQSPVCTTDNGLGLTDLDDKNVQLVVNALCASDSCQRPRDQFGCNKTMFRTGFQISAKRQNYAALLFDNCNTAASQLYTECWQKQKKGGFIGFGTATSQEYYELRLEPLRSNTLPSPTSSTPAMPTSSTPATPTEPTNLNCYLGKVSPPFRSFDYNLVSQPGGPIDTFCDGYVNGLNFPSTLYQFFNLDPSVLWYQSKYFAEISILHSCDDPNPTKDLANQCKFALAKIVYNCDWGSGDKHGGTADWKCMSYKINGNTGTGSTPWQGNGA